jgi:hypothetical protein
MVGGSGGGGGGSSGGARGGRGGPEPNEFWWDVAGWVTLGALIVGVMVLGRSSQQAAVGK